MPYTVEDANSIVLNFDDAGYVVDTYSTVTLNFAPDGGPGSTNISLSGSAGALALDGILGQLSVSLSISITGEAGGYAVDGKLGTSDVSNNVNISGISGGISLDGNTPVFGADANLAGLTGGIALDGKAGDFHFNSNLFAQGQSGTLTFTGRLGQFSAGAQFFPEAPGTLELGGNQAKYPLTDTIGIHDGETDPLVFDLYINSLIGIGAEICQTSLYTEQVNKTVEHNLAANSVLNVTERVSRSLHVK